MSAADYAGRFIHYGIREHGMAAAMNGMALHGGIIPYSGTFLVFSDYCRPAIRLAALMGERVIYVMTHDFDRPRRGRPDASAGRASRRAARHPEPAACSARATRSRPPSAGSSRCEATRPPERAGADAAEPAAAAPATSTSDNRCAAGAYEIVAGRRQGARCRSSPPARKSRSRSRRRSCSPRKGVAARVVSVPCFELLLASAGRRRAAPSSATRRSRSASKPAVRQGWDAIIGSDGVFVGMTRLRRQRALQGSLQAFRHHRRKRSPRRR